MTVETVQAVESAGSAACTLMPVAEAVMLLRCSPEYLYAGLRSKRFPGASYGRSRLISRPFVEAFLTQAARTAIDFEEFATHWIAGSHSAEVAV